MLGAHAASLLAQRLADLEACGSVQEFTELFPGDVSPLGADTFVLRVAETWTITMRAAHVKPKQTTTSDTDWARVTRVMITAVDGNND